MIESLLKKYFNLVTENYYVFYHELSSIKFSLLNLIIYLSDFPCLEAYLHLIIKFKSFICFSTDTNNFNPLELALIK